MGDASSLVLEELFNAEGHLEIIFQKRAEGLWPSLRF